MPYLSLTTWSLHRNLGPLRMTRWDSEARSHVIEEKEQPETLKLLDLPRAAAERGIRSLEVCHFNFPLTDADYLRNLREAFQQAGVSFYSLLVDYGDITSRDGVRRQADTVFIRRWIDVASAVGAERVRVVAGEADPGDAESLKLSADSLRELAGYAMSRGVRVVTENFRSLASTPENCLSLLKNGERDIGLTADFGNFKGPGKFDALEKIVPFAESIHAKAHYDAQGMPDREEFIRCLEIVKRSQYEGPITLVYDGPGDQWAGIGRIAEIVSEYFD